MPMGKGRLERYQRLRDLAKCIVDDPHNIDADIKAKLKTATLKYASTLHDDPSAALEVLYHDQNGLGSLVRKAVTIVDEADADDNDDDDGGGGGGASDHPVTQLARLLVASGKFSEHAQALHWLLHHPNGHALVRTHKAEKEQTIMSSLQDIVKAHGVDGVVQIAKNIVEEQKSFRITEEEFVKLIDTAARVAHPELGARSFEKVFERNPLLAQALNVTKGTFAEQLLSGGLPVRVVSGEDARDLGDESEAISQLKELGRRKWPTASEAQQFANAFTDPVNKEIANRAHKRPVPPAGGAYAWPR